MFANNPTFFENCTMDLDSLKNAAQNTEQLRLTQEKLRKTEAKLRETEKKLRETQAKLQNSAALVQLQLPLTENKLRDTEKKLVLVQDELYNLKEGMQKKLEAAFKRYVDDLRPRVLHVVREVERRALTKCMRNLFGEDTAGPGWYDTERELLDANKKRKLIADKNN